jgi:hypothetical protein
LILNNLKIFLQIIQMEKENYVMYILKSKENIDRYIAANNYKSAFGLLLSVLDRLDGNEKNEFITYYLNDFFVIKPTDSHLNPR